MVNRKAARRYTAALYGLAEELKQTEAIRKDFEDIKNSVSSSKELKMFIESPIINPAKKSDILGQLFKGKITDLSMKFILLLCEKKRINMLQDIIDTMLKLINEKRGIIEANVTTAIDMTDKEKKSITAMLKKFSGKEINPHFSTDKAIKGGFIAKMEDRIIDASIARQLELLKDRFLQGSFNN